MYLKLLVPEAFFSAQNAPNNVWQPGSALTHWGSLGTPPPPDPLAAIRGLLLRGGEGREGGEEEERGLVPPT